MKIIFLDIDGVLNSASFMKRRQRVIDKNGPDRFRWWLEMLDEEAIQLLNQAVEATGAKIVVSSTWRILNDVPTLTKLLKTRGFVGEVIDITPRLPFDQRGDEIALWLKQNPVDDFVIIDDDSDMSHLMHKLVHTSWQTGIQPKHVEEIISRLGARDEVE